MLLFNIMLSSGLLQICKQQYPMIVGLSMKKFRIHLCKDYFTCILKKMTSCPKFLAGFQSGLLFLSF